MAGTPRLQIVLIVLVLCLSVSSAAYSQSGKGEIEGRVTDSSGAVLPGAVVNLAPGGIHAVSDINGGYAVPGMAPGDYTETVEFLGFKTYTTSVHVQAGESVRVDPKTGSGRTERGNPGDGRQVAWRSRQINRQRTADNIVQVLSSEVITSLPNANIADALGRLPSVTLERDEGEGKYVQIRGTEPRLSNLTIDGVNVPSPESGVRQIKLDTIASDLVESVEINKTLQANMDGDGIGGSVNIRTKTAADQPMAMVLRRSAGTRRSSAAAACQQLSGTVGERFGADKHLGRAGRRHVRLERPRHQRPRALADGLEPQPALRQHGSARLPVLPHAVGSHGQHRLPGQQRTSLALRGPLLDVPELGPEVGLRAERRRRARREHRLAPSGLRGWQPRRRADGTRSA